MLTIYFERKSEMTAFAKSSKKESVRCKLPCGHVSTARPAMLLFNCERLEAKLIRCKVCNRIQLAKGGENEDEN